MTTACARNRSLACGCATCGNCVTQAAATNATMRRIHCRRRGPRRRRTVCAKPFSAPTSPSAPSPAASASRLQRRCQKAGRSSRARTARLSTATIARASPRGAFPRRREPPPHRRCSGRRATISLCTCTFTPSHARPSNLKSVLYERRVHRTVHEALNLALPLPSRSLPLPPAPSLLLFYM